MTALLVAISLLTVSVAFAADDGNRQNSVAENNVALSNQKVDEASELYDSGNYGDAVQSASEAIALNPQNANAYFRRGTAYNDLKQYERAIADLDKAIELKPDYATAYNNRGKCYQALGDTAKAQANFDKAKALGYNG